jgi:hypothetical protein
MMMNEGEPFPRVITSKDDWDNFLFAYENLNQDLRELAESYSEMLFEYGFKIQPKYAVDREDKMVLDHSYVTFEWDSYHCGSTKNYEFILPIKYLFMTDPLDGMREDIEADAKRRDKKADEEEARKKEEISKLQSAFKQKEIEKILKKMEEDPEFAKQILGFQS